MCLNYRCIRVALLAALSNLFIAPLSHASLVSWWRAEGNALDSAGTNNGSLFGGTSFGSGINGQGFQFDGVDDVVNVPDSPSLTITGSLTIDVWIKPFAYTSGNGGLIVFRGDDRAGFDPYFLRLGPDGKVEFTIENSANTASSVLSQTIPLNTFSHLTATLDDITGQQTLYVNGALSSLAFTTVRPLGALDSTQNPGFSIGNHNRYPPFVHNQPFNGIIDEVQIYNNVVAPEPSIAVASFVACLALGTRVNGTRRKRG